MASPAAAGNYRRLTVVSGGHNHIRDYVSVVLAEATSEAPRSVVLRAKTAAMSKAISVAEVSRRLLAERGLSSKTTSRLQGLRAEGEERRSAPVLEIVLEFGPRSEAVKPV
mmetsp:Transcript_64391/g.149798  ORF Transcript_64391/g.149798 Transcript_64391/m.149798 type:complete len:111 (+) Transcript_64391:65-397(+)